MAKDRIVAQSREPLPLNVFCVEHGRWSSGWQLNRAKTIVHPSVREQAAVKQKQDDVWAAVTAGSVAEMSSAAPAPRVPSADLQATIREEAPTQSYSKIYESRRVGASVETVVSEIQRRFRKETSGLKGERVVGVVVAYGGEVAWCGIFGSDELVNQYWGKLLGRLAVGARCGAAHS